MSRRNLFKDDQILTDFLIEVRGKKVLCPAEMRALCEQRDNGNPTAISRMAEGNLRLILTVLRKYNYTGKGISCEDLFQYGAVGLLKAAQKYQPDLGAFSTYAIWWIRQEMSKEVYRGSDSIGRPTTLERIISTYRIKVEELRQKLRREPSLREKSEYLNTSEKRIYEIEQTYRTTASLDANSSERTHWVESFYDPDCSSPEELAAVRSERKKLRLMLRDFPRQYRDILQRVYYRNQPYRSIGKELGLSGQRIKQIQQKILEQICKSEEVKYLSDII